jgi:hypothetical protein
MVAVRGVVIGREHGGEETAGAVADLAQEAAPGAGIAPVGGDRDPGPVAEAEAGMSSALARACSLQPPSSRP